MQIAGYGSWGWKRGAVALFFIERENTDQTTPHTSHDPQPTICALPYSPVTSTLMLRGLAASFLGSTTVRTPAL